MHERKCEVFAWKWEKKKFQTDIFFLTKGLFFYFLEFCRLLRRIETTAMYFPIMTKKPIILLLVKKQRERSSVDKSMLITVTCVLTVV